MKADDISIRQSKAEYAILKAESQILRTQTEAFSQMRGVCCQLYPKKLYRKILGG